MNRRTFLPTEEVADLDKDVNLRVDYVNSLAQQHASIYRVCFRPELGGLMIAQPVFLPQLSWPTE